ncbi:MAG: DUF4011 domain-containing protein [Bacteroidaceae bacterium]|nr:DUF4011 domain-containing protein [Bacteroidaceae bacterium]
MGQKLHNRIETWKKLLLDFGKRNRLINFRESKRSNVRILVPSYDTIFERLAVREEAMSFPYSKKVIIDDAGEEIFEEVIKGDFETNKTISELQKSLKVLRYRANTSIEEQGINILFLTFGMLKWRERDDSTEVYSSPLVLVPVKLTIESLTSPYILSLHEDEIVVNPTLLHKLGNDFGILLPEFDGTQDSISAYLKKCESVIENKGWTIERSVHLTNLSFLKINMYKDLERNEEKLSAHPIISAIAGEGEALSLPEDINDYDHDRNERPINVFQVVDADASQQDAILLSKRGVSFVLQGPPGTGKSQTITNIISEALADGKKVLFVSEKMAALQVVYNRLSNVGLADFCFTLHSHKANKKEILHELANSISIDRKKVRDEALAQLDILEKKRESLNKYQEELHTRCSALNYSIFEVNGKIAKLNAVPDIIFPIQDVEKTDARELNNRVYLLSELSKTIGKRSEDYEKNLWKGTKVVYLSNELRHDIDSNVAELIPFLSTLDDKISMCTNKMGIKVEHTIAGTCHLISLLKVLRSSPLIPENWLSDNFDRLFKKIDEQKELKDILNSNYHHIIRKFHPKILNVFGKTEYDSFRTCASKVLSLFVFDNKDKLVDNLPEIHQKLTNYEITINFILSHSEKLADELGLKAPKNLSELSRFEDILNVLTAISGVNPTEKWFQSKTFYQIKESVSSHHKIHSDYITKVADILKRYDKEILNLDYYSMLQRFRGEYGTIFRFLKSQYRKDIRLIRGFSKDGSKQSYSKVYSVLKDLKDIAETKENINLIAEQCKEDYGDYYLGLETSWDDLERILCQFENFLNSITQIPLRFKQTILSKNIPLDDVKQFISSLKTSEIIEQFNNLSKLIIIDTNDDLKEIDRILQQSINSSDEFIRKYDEIKRYRNDKTTYEELVDDLDYVVNYQQTLKSIESQKVELQKKFSFYYKGLDTDWDSIHDALHFAKELKTCIGTYSLSKGIISRICQDSSFIDYCEGTYIEFSCLIDSIITPFDWFSSLFEEKDKFANVNLLDLSDYLASCKNNKHQLEEWIDYQSIRKECAKVGLSSYTDQIEKKLIDNNYIVDAYLKRFYRLWLDHILQQFPSVRDFRGRIQEQNIQEFCALDIEQFKIARARVRERLVNRIPDFNAITSSRDEIGILKRELNKQRRIMPLRKLFMAIPNLMSALRPCFMMSPLSVSIFLEAQSYEFDLVIFDEASQVHTEDAIGAIMRGKQVIIVGDTKQLPPTNFFATTLNDEDFDIDNGDEETDNDAGAYESILDETVAILPERSLRWHYRSRDEHLIAFSNIKIYNRSLITFPSSIEKALDLGVEYVYVSNGIYDRGGKKNNMIEAKRVAQLVFEHFKKYPQRSLGVVTFSEAQQNAVDAAIRQMRLNNGAFEKFFADNVDEPFFIKNLENVQGDERDTIIFSIGYAKDSRGVMYMNFGPLSRNGGYRRLNVAITRAKYNVKLVGSIQATDIDLEKTSSEGVKLLRSYIEYAQQGIVALDKELDYNYELTFDSPFEESVYDLLSAKGYEVVTQVGCSGFRIDMAIKNPTQKGKFAIGIECDGATYHNSRTARERDRLRQTVLEDMGWTIYRIWSTDWIKNQKSEEEKLIKAIDAALAGVSVESPVEASIETEKSPEINAIEIEEEVESRVDVNSGYGFDEYKSVGWRDFWNGDVTETIKKVIENQQPIHFEALCRILAPIWGNQKATNVIRNEVRFYFRNYLSGIVNFDCDFVSLNGFNDLKVRVPKSSNDIRPIEYICDSELALALTTIAQHSFGISPDNLITETARAFGFKRTGGNISFNLKRVYEKLLLDEKIKEIDGKVSVI